MSNVEEFRLQSVLNLKSSLADTLEVEFAHLKVTHQNEVTRLEKLQRHKTEEMEVLSQQQQSGPLDCCTIELRQQYLQTLAEHETAQTTRVNNAEHKAETKREELVKTVQDQKTLEKLRDQHETKQRQLLLHREANMIDDLVMTRYARER
jgi:flagellar export protein FliJ